MQPELRELLIDSVSLFPKADPDEWGNQGFVDEEDASTLLCLIDRDTISRSGGKDAGEQLKESPSHSVSIYFDNDFTGSVGDKIVIGGESFFITSVEKHGDVFDSSIVNHYVVDAAIKEMH